MLLFATALIAVKECFYYG